MLFYFVRHGQTDANVGEVLAGSGLDHSLNEEGHRQARRLAAQLRHLLHVPPRRLIVSEMKRTRQTATYLAEALALEAEVHAGWREWHLGEWEGGAWATFGALMLNGGEPKSGEARQVFYDRVRAAWTDVHSDEHPYLVVSHGGVWLALQDLLEIPRFKINNCDLIRLERTGARWNATLVPLKTDKV